MPAQVKMYTMHLNGTLADMMEACKSLWESTPSSTISSTVIVLCMLMAMALWASHGKRPVYLCDFYTFHPPEYLGGGVGAFVNGMRRSKRWNEQSLDFMDKVSNISGLGEQTYFPAGELTETILGSKGCRELWYLMHMLLGDTGLQ